MSAIRRGHGMAAGLRRQGPGHGIAVLLLLLAAQCPAASGQQAIPLDVRDGRCSCILPTRRHDDKYFLIVASLTRGAGPYRVVLRTESAAGPAEMSLDHSSPDDRWSQHIAELRDRLERARRVQSVEESTPRCDPPLERLFHIFTGEQDFERRESYAEIRAELRAVGRH